MPMSKRLTGINGWDTGRDSRKSLSGSSVMYVLSYILLLQTWERGIFWMYQGKDFGLGLLGLKGSYAYSWFLCGTRCFGRFEGLDRNRNLEYCVFCEVDVGGLRDRRKRMLWCITSLINAF